MYNFYNRSQTRRRRGCAPLISLLVVCLVLGGAGYLVYTLVHQATAKDAGGFSNASQVTLTMSVHPTVIIESCTGYLHVHGTATLSNKITLAGEPIPDYTQDSIRNQVIIQGCDLTISVPVETNLIADADAIDVFGVNGHMQLSANGGKISVLQSVLTGDSKLTNNGGPIRFSGSLGAQSTPTLDTNGGMINVSLAHDAAFHVKVSGILNTITSDFPAIKQPAELTSHSIDVSIGTAPSATLTLDVNSSPIVLSAY